MSIGSEASNPRGSLICNLGAVLKKRKIKIRDFKDIISIVAEREGLPDIALSTLYTYTGDGVTRFPSAENIYLILRALKELEKPSTFDELVMSRPPDESESRETEKTRKEIEWDIEQYSNQARKKARETAKLATSTKEASEEVSEKETKDKVSETKDIEDEIEKIKGDNTQQSQLYLLLGELHQRYGNYKWARGCFEKAKKKAIRLSDKVRALKGVALVDYYLQKNVQAFSTCQEALNLLRDDAKWTEDDFVLEGWLLLIQGNSLRKLGFIKQQHYELALLTVEHVFTKEANNLRGHIFNHVGILWQESGLDIERAIRNQQEAVKRFQDANEKDGEAIAQMYLAKSLYYKALTHQESRREGLLHEADDFIERSQKHFESTGHKKHLGDCYQIRGLLWGAHSYRRDFTKATRDFKISLALYDGDDPSKLETNQFFVYLRMSRVELLKALNTAKGNEEKSEALNQAKEYLDKAELLLKMGLQNHWAIRYFHVCHSNYDITYIRILGAKDVKERKKRWDSGVEHCTKAFKGECENNCNEGTKLCDDCLDLVFGENKPKKGQAGEYNLDEHNYSVKEDKDVARAYLNLSWLYLDAFKHAARESLEKEELKESPDKTRSLYYIFKAITLFELYDNQLYTGLCYYHRAEITNEYAKSINEQKSSSWLRKQYSLYSLAYKCFDAVGRKDWTRKTNYKLSQLLKDFPYSTRRKMEELSSL